ncbi:MULTISPECIES: hypothetical protein [Streptomyces]|uniref:Secreted protein n=1 Tax=Streptomyces griseiscabiei TaxID=2993540 RepID=A0ABU4L5X4_9ACTN|nr:MULTISPECIES: hypothetical protein [Streptomyces]MDX2911179.1 hypothetical protein [Streptomyces griseiscabiei]
MLLLVALVIGAIALLLAMEAGATWFTIVPLGILTGGATVLHSLGWFNKKVRD